MGRDYQSVRDEITEEKLFKVCYQILKCIVRKATVLNFAIARAGRIGYISDLILSQVLSFEYLCNTHYCGGQQCTNDVGSSYMYLFCDHTEYNAGSTSRQRLYGVFSTIPYIVCFDLGQ